MSRQHKCIHEQTHLFTILLLKYLQYGLIQDDEIFKAREARLMEGDNELYSKKRVMIFWFRWMQVE
jgi:hypothetical protein